MYSEFDFGRRLSQLRERKGVSARDMSLSMGQNPGYINKVENGKAMPSMEVFFYICEFLAITPSDFFDEKKKEPWKLHQLTEECRYLSSESLEHILAIVKESRERDSPPAAGRCGDIIPYRRRYWLT